MWVGAPDNRIMVLVIGHVLTPRAFSKPFPVLGPGLTAHPKINCSTTGGGMPEDFSRFVADATAW
jgi:hypothetical protein